MSPAADNFSNAKTEFQYFMSVIDLRVGSWKIAMEKLSAAYVAAHDDVTGCLGGHGARQFIGSMWLSNVVTTLATQGAGWMLSVGALGGILGASLAAAVSPFVPAAVGTLSFTGLLWTGILTTPNFGSKDGLLCSFRLRQAELEQRRNELYHRMLVENFMGDYQAGSAAWATFRPGQMIAAAHDWLEKSKEFRGAGGLPSVEEMTREFTRTLWARLAQKRWNFGFLPGLVNVVPERIRDQMKAAGVPLGSKWRPALTEWAESYQPVDFVKMAELSGKTERFALPPTPSISGGVFQQSHAAEMARLLNYFGNRPDNVGPGMNMVRTQVAADLYATPRSE